MYSYAGEILRERIEGPLERHFFHRFDFRVDFHIRKSIPNRSFHLGSQFPEAKLRKSNSKPIFLFRESISHPKITPRRLREAKIARKRSPRGISGASVANRVLPEPLGVRSGLHCGTGEGAPGTSKTSIFLKETHEFPLQEHPAFRHRWRYPARDHFTTLSTSAPPPYTIVF